MRDLRQHLKQGLLTNADGYVIATQYLYKLAKSKPLEILHKEIKSIC